MCSVRIMARKVGRRVHKEVWDERGVFRRGLSTISSFLFGGWLGRTKNGPVRRCGPS